MNPIIATFNDTSSVQDLQLKGAPAANLLQRNATKTDNKATQSVQSLEKSDSRQTAEKEQSHSKKSDLAARLEKRSDNNIAREKVENRQLDDKAVKDTTALEVKKTYQPEQTEKISAAEEAIIDQDALERVKSVKPDGTETYYFPVPIEVLTQLPPPGNIGLSEKMMEQIFQDNIDKAAENKDAQEIAIQKVNDTTQKIELTSVNNNVEQQDIETQKVQNTPPPNEDTAIDYGFG